MLHKLKTKRSLRKDANLFRVVLTHSFADIGLEKSVLFYVHV